MSRTYDIGNGQSTDGLVVRAGDVVRIAPGAVVRNKHTLILPSSAKVYSPDASKPARIISDANGVSMDRNATASMVANLEFQTPLTQQEYAAVNCSGVKCTVSNIKQLGAGDVLRCDHARDCDFDLLDGSAGTFAKHGIYGTDVWRCRFRRFKLLMRGGTGGGPEGATHGIRLHEHHDCVIGDETLRWPIEGQPGKFETWAFWVLDESPYSGSAVTLKEGTNPQLLHGKSGQDGRGGTIRLGALTQEGSQAKRLVKGLVRWCEFNVGRGTAHNDEAANFWINAGVSDVLVADTIIRSADVPCLRLDGSFTVRAGNKADGAVLGVMPAVSGLAFERVQLLGTNPMTQSSVEHWKAARRVGCSLNGKAYA